MAHENSEILHFSANEHAIELDMEHAQIYTEGSYNSSAMAKGYTWHQIAILHKDKLLMEPHERKDEILQAIFKLIGGESLFPIKYRYGELEDKFLCRECRLAMDKLFAHGLRITTVTGKKLALRVELNVAVYNYSQISPVTKINQALQALFKTIEMRNDGILNLTNFGKRKEFEHIVVNLANREVLGLICELLFGMEQHFHRVRGINFSQNGINTLLPVQKQFKDVKFELLDLSDNELRFTDSVMRDLKYLKATEVRFMGNPITRTKNYPECLKPLYGNFARIDGIAIENLTKDYERVDFNVCSEFDGYRIDWSNKVQISKFKASEHWHAVMIPDRERELKKDDVFLNFFKTISEQHGAVFPCFYKFEKGEHQFLLRKCYEQLANLAFEHNFELSVPLVVPSTSETPTNDEDSAAEAAIPAYSNKTFYYYLIMNLASFKVGQIEPAQVFDKALNRCYSHMDRRLDLSNFQRTQGLENIILDLSNAKVLQTVLDCAARKFMQNCVDLRLSKNCIKSFRFNKSLKFMSNLKAIDLSNNCIDKIEHVQDLKRINLKSLSLADNPLCAKYTFPKDYINAVRTHFPHIIKLDDVDITDKMCLRAQKNYLLHVQHYDFVADVVPRFLSIFESDKRCDMTEWYHPAAIFTMVCNVNLSSYHENRIMRYKQQARNLFTLNSLRQSSISVYYKPENIMVAFWNLPTMLHDMHSMSTDVYTLNKDLLVVQLAGVFEDKASDFAGIELRMSFTRTLIFMPVKKNQGIFKGLTQYQITNDQFSIFTAMPAQLNIAFKHERTLEMTVPLSPSVLISDEDKLVSLAMFQEIVGLKRVWCSKILEEAKWDFKKSLELCRKYCQRKEIPHTAFEPLQKDK